MTLVTAQARNHYVPRWHLQLLTPGYSLRAFGLLLYPDPLVSLSLPFLHCLIAPLSGDQSLCSSGLSQEWSQEYCNRQALLGHSLPPKACAASDWWSSRTSALSGPHDASLVFISGLLFTLAAQVAPWEGPLSWLTSPRA